MSEGTGRRTDETGRAALLLMGSGLVLLILAVVLVGFP